MIEFDTITHEHNPKGWPQGTVRTESDWYVFIYNPPLSTGELAYGLDNEMRRGWEFTAQTDISGCCDCLVLTRVSE